MDGLRVSEVNLIKGRSLVLSLALHIGSRIFKSMRGCCDDFCPRARAIYIYIFILY